MRAITLFPAALLGAAAMLAGTSASAQMSPGSRAGGYSSATSANTGLQVGTPGNPTTNGPIGMGVSGEGLVGANPTNGPSARTGAAPMLSGGGPGSSVSYGSGLGSAIDTGGMPQVASPNISERAAANYKSGARLAPHAVQQASTASDLAPEDALRNAQQALAGQHLAAARQALDQAAAKLRDRIASNHGNPPQDGAPDDRATLRSVSAARQALLRGDAAVARRQVDGAVSSLPPAGDK
jgi:hypothetical protein